MKTYTGRPTVLFVAMLFSWAAVIVLAVVIAILLDSVLNF